MKELIKSISRLSISTILNIVSSIIKSKLLAIFSGPSGVGIYSQFINLSGLTTSILPVGSLGLVNYTSKLYDKNKLEELGVITGYFLKRNLLFSFIFTLIMILFAENISNILFSNNNYSNLIILFSLFIPVNLLVSFIDIYLKGIRKLNIYVLFLSVNTITSLFITVLLILFFSVTGAIYGLIFSVFSNLVIGLIILRKNKLFIKINLKNKIALSTRNNIYALGIGTIITLISQNLTILVIKGILADKINLASVGIFQSVYSISAAYFGIFFTLIGSYSIPKMSTFDNVSDMILEMNTTIRLLLLVYTPIILSIFVFRIFIITILYSSEFIDAQYLLIFQLPAELFRALSWVMGLWLVPKFKIKQWIIFDLIFYIMYLSIFYLLINNFNYGIVSVSLSYFISYIVYFIINFIYSYSEIDFKFDKNNLKIIFVSIIMIFSVFLTSYFYIQLSYFLIFVFLITWVYLFIKKNDISAFLELLKVKK